MPNGKKKKGHKLPQLQACQGVRGEDEEQLSIQRKNITI